LGWHGLSRDGIQVFESPGAHGAMTVAPYAKGLAQLLLPVLLELAARGKGSHTVLPLEASSELPGNGGRARSTPMTVDG
jgi:hypothetical protein